MVYVNNGDCEDNGDNDCVFIDHHHQDNQHFL